MRAAVQARPGRDGQLLRRIAALFRPYRSQVLLLVGAIVAGSVLGVGNPLLTKVVFDRALFPHGRAHPHLALLVGVAALMVVVVVLGGALGILQTYLASVIGEHVMRDLRDDLYAHLQRMSLRFFTATRSGEVHSRIGNDVGGVGDVVTGTAATTLGNLVFILSSVIAMTILSWQLTALAVVLVPGFVYLTLRAGRARRRLVSTTQESMAELNVIAYETLSVSGALLGKVFARERDAVDRYRTESNRLAQLRIRQEMVGRVLLGASQTFFLLAPGLVYVLAGFLLSRHQGGLTAGTLVAFTALQARLFFPVKGLMEVSVSAQAGLALFERVFEYLDLPTEIADAPGARTLRRDEVRGAVSYRGVRFRYAEDVEARNGRPWTLDGIDLTIEPGQLAAVVGPSGAGKTTLCYLLPRLYDVSAGSVAIDGVDVREIKLASLAGIVGMVTQESFLLHASLAENLRYARPDATQADLEAAARAAFIHGRVCELPQGYDTIVGERGFRLSGGEKQRLAIARVILKDPPILVFDEATSALDAESERLVQAALEPLRTGRTTIAIAHRLSTILAADVVFVLDRGRLVERGTHAELLARGGLYARLYEGQSMRTVPAAETR